MPACDFDVETSLSELWQRSKKVVKFARFLIAQLIKNPPSMLEIWVRSLGWEDPLEVGHGNPVQYSCLENPHGQRSLAGYYPWDHKESDMTERLSTVQHRRRKKFP